MKKIISEEKDNLMDIKFGKEKSMHGERLMFTRNLKNILNIEDGNRER